MARVKPICFYLPQFHRIPENDRWWGEGFTEWDLVRQSKPRFPHHHQPNLPDPELGAYDLLDPHVRNRQGELARQYGVFGFCYYHYWFAGKKLLEHPLELMLQDGYPDLPFCLNWANESWTRSWFGQSHEILQPQEYGDEAAWRQHASYLLSFWTHPRYIKVNDRPVMLIYRLADIPCARAMLHVWRHQAQAAGLPDLHVVAVLGEYGTTGLPLDLVDGVCEFYPPYLWRNGITGFHVNRMVLETADEARRRIVTEPKVHPVQYRGAFVAWDNTPRRNQGGGVVYLQARPDLLFKLLQRQGKRLLADTAMPDSLLFINAWNEWGEGAYLEPDLRWGRAYLEALHRAMAGLDSLDTPGAEPLANRVSPDETPASVAADLLVQDVSTPHPAPVQHRRNPLRLAPPSAGALSRRLDVAAMVVSNGIQAKRCLELGCGEGLTSQLLKDVLQTTCYVGVEPDDERAGPARARLDHVFVSTLDAGTLAGLGLPTEPFDLLIALDILGRLSNPWDVLAEAVALLRPGSYAIIALPNVQHISILAHLADGHWPYQKAGLLNTDCLRFFTLESALDLVAGADLVPRQTISVFPQSPALPSMSEAGNTIQYGRLTLANLTREQLSRLFASQFLILAQKPVGAPLKTGIPEPH